MSRPLSNGRGILAGQRLAKVANGGIGTVDRDCPRRALILYGFGQCASVLGALLSGASRLGVCRRFTPMVTRHRPYFDAASTALSSTDVRGARGPLFVHPPLALREQGVGSSNLPAPTN